MSSLVAPSQLSSLHQDRKKSGLVSCASSINDHSANCNSNVHHNHVLLQVNFTMRLCLAKNTVILRDWREQSDWHTAIGAHVGGQVLYATTMQTTFLPLSM